MSEVGEWEERTNVSHNEQMERWGWCICEDTNGEGHLSEGCEPSLKGVKKITLLVDEEWLEAIDNLTREVYDGEVCTWLSIEEVEA